ncbi:MAG: tRNA pseudouridine(13) synthase TruD [Patescibacteria group bacterium]
MNTQEAWGKQQEIIEYYKKNDPGILERKKGWLEDKIFSEIGIENMPDNRPAGYLRLFLQDFIVEEKIKDKIIRINELNSINSKQTVTEKEKTLYAHLVKIGIPTNVAVERISESLNYEKKKIGFAGLKDADAITAQLIAMPRIKMSVNEIEKIKIQNVLLTNFHYAPGSLNPGDLDRNVFTITIRAKEKIDEQNFSIKLKNIEKYGILNYFQSQRFGGLRLISHKLGKLILQGNYESAVKYFLLKSNEYDIPLVAELRKSAEEKYPGWGKMMEIYEKFPYSFFNELKALEYLKNNPNNFIGALIEINDQTKLWVFAYSSWLFNKFLSDYSKINGCVKEEFPILFSSNPEDYKSFKKYLIEDGTLDFAKNLYPFKFIQLKKRLISGRIFPEDINYKIFNGGAVINFSLPKACYATTFLSNLFELTVGLPIPEWVNTEEIDPKEIIGQGSIAEVKEKFKDCWYSKLDQL